MKTVTYFHAANADLDIEVEVNDAANVAVHLEVARDAEFVGFISKAQALELMQALSAALLDADVVEAGVETAADFEKLQAEALADEKAEAIDADGDPGRRGLMTELP